jgi:excisionase family DNA binding protein
MADPIGIGEGEAAKRTGLSARALASLRRRGEVPAHRVGRRVLYSPLELDAWLRGQPNTVSK